MARKNIKRPRPNSRKKRKLRVWQEQAIETEAQEMADRILRNPCKEIEGPVGVQASIFGQPDDQKDGGQPAG